MNKSSLSKIMLTSNIFFCPFFPQYEAWAKMFPCILNCFEYTGSIYSVRSTGSYQYSPRNCDYMRAGAAPWNSFLAYYCNIDILLVNLQGYPICYFVSHEAEDDGVFWATASCSSLLLCNNCLYWPSLTTQ